MVYALRRIVIFLLLINSLTGCSVIYIKASDFRLEDLIEEPRIGSKRIFKKGFKFPVEIEVVYEMKKKENHFFHLRDEMYNSGDSTLYISYFYKEMKIQDDLFSDDETFPIVTGSKGRIIGYGWQFVDSLKQIRFLDRIKK